MSHDTTFGSDRRELVPDTEMSDPRWFPGGDGDYLIPKTPEEAQELLSTARESIGFVNGVIDRHNARTLGSTAVEPVTTADIIDAEGPE